MKSLRIPLLIMLALSMLSTANLVQAQGKTNVNGTWKMNAEKSKFERGGPKDINIKFEQQGSSLHETFTINTGNGERVLNLNYTLDGKESPQQLENEEIMATAKWEGEALVIEFKNAKGFTFLRKFTVSADGKTMTIDAKQTSSRGSANDIILLDKQ